jgi:hypothetical protein
VSAAAALACNDFVRRRGVRRGQWLQRCSVEARGQLAGRPQLPAGLPAAPGAARPARTPPHFLTPPSPPYPTPPQHSYVLYINVGPGRMYSKTGEWPMYMRK